MNAQADEIPGRAGMLLAVSLAERGIELDRRGMTEDMCRLLDLGQMLAAALSKAPRKGQDVLTGPNIVDARARFQAR